MKLVITEKPSVAQSIARVIGANKRNEGFMEGNRYLVSWFVFATIETPFRTLSSCYFGTITFI